MVWKLNRDGQRRVSGSLLISTIRGAPERSIVSMNRCKVALLPHSLWASFSGSLSIGSSNFSISSKACWFFSKVASSRMRFLVSQGPSFLNAFRYDHRNGTRFSSPHNSTNSIRIVHILNSERNEFHPSIFSTNSPCTSVNLKYLP